MEKSVVMSLSLCPAKSRKMTSEELPYKVINGYGWYSWKVTNFKQWLTLEFSIVNCFMEHHVLTHSLHFNKSNPFHDQMIIILVICYSDYSDSYVMNMVQSGVP